MLKIRNLTVLVEGKKVVDGVSLVVKRGEVAALMGPNGSGKTSLAYALAGHPGYKIEKRRRMIEGRGKIRGKKKERRSGEMGVWLDGKDLLDLSPSERAKAGLFLAFQQPVAIPGVTVEGFLKRAYEEVCCSQCREGGRLTEGCGKMSVWDFREMLEKKAEQLGIENDWLSRSVNDGFSGGEKKRLEILQMEVLRPKYAVLDETDSGLDVDAVRLMARHVGEWVERQKGGVLLITHYQRFLKYIRPDKVVVMVEGKIVRRGGKELVREVEKKGYGGM